MRKVKLAIVSAGIMLVSFGAAYAVVGIVRGPAVCAAPSEDSVPAGPGYSFHDGAWHCG